MRMPKRSFRYDIFLSYSHRDSKIVLEIAEELRSRGFRVFLDIWEMKSPEPVGTVFGIETLDLLLDALSSSQSAVLFHGSISKSWVIMERKLASIRQIKDNAFGCMDVNLELETAIDGKAAVRTSSADSICRKIIHTLGFKGGFNEPDRFDPIDEETAQFAPPGEYYVRAEFDFWAETHKNDLIIAQTGHYRTQLQEDETRFIELIEWDQTQSQFKRQYIFQSEIERQYNPGSGWDTYHDKKIENLKLKNHILQFQVHEIVERENVWISEHEVIKDNVTLFMYDIKKRKLITSPF
jgi:hypothetical protein